MTITFNNCGDSEPDGMKKGLSQHITFQSLINRFNSGLVINSKNENINKLSKGKSTKTPTAHNRYSTTINVDFKFVVSRLLDFIIIAVIERKEHTKKR